MAEDTGEIEWIEGCLLMCRRSRSGRRLLIEFSDMDGPCWCGCEVHVELYRPGYYGPGVFGLPGWLVKRRISVVDAQAAERMAAADRADAEERAKAAAAKAAREQQKAERRRRPPSRQFGFDL